MPKCSCFSCVTELITTLENLIYHISKTYAVCSNLLYFTYSWLYAEIQSASVHVCVSVQLEKCKNCHLI